MRTRTCVVAGLAILLLAGAAEWPEFRSPTAVLTVEALPGEQVRVIADVPGKKRVETTVKIEAGGTLALSNANPPSRVTMRSLSMDLPDEKSPALTPISLDEAVRIALLYAKENHSSKHGEEWTSVLRAERFGESWSVTFCRSVKGGVQDLTISIDRNRKARSWGGGVAGGP
jgi:hypothetical protein